MNKDEIDLVVSKLGLIKSKIADYRVSINDSIYFIGRCMGYKELENQVLNSRPFRFETLDLENNRIIFRSYQKIVSRRINSQEIILVKNGRV